MPGLWEGCGPTGIKAGGLGTEMGGGTGAGGMRIGGGGGGSGGGGGNNGTVTVGIVTDGSVTGGGGIGGKPAPAEATQPANSTGMNRAT